MSLLCSAAPYCIAWGPKGKPKWPSDPISPDLLESSCLLGANVVPLKVDAWQCRGTLRCKDNNDWHATTAIRIDLLYCHLGSTFSIFVGYLWSSLGTNWSQLIPVIRGYMAPFIKQMFGKYLHMHYWNCTWIWPWQKDKTSTNPNLMLGVICWKAEKLLFLA